MDNRLVIAEKIRESFEKDPIRAFKRDLSLAPAQEPARGNLVRTIAGVRRCGKTYRLFQEMGELLGAGVERERMLYFDFADERLKPYDALLPSRVIDEYYALFPGVRDKGVYLFFDEMQDVPEWGAFLRRLVDTEQATIYVTGSSSKLLSSQIASEFRGRSLTRELFPMSFSEFVRFHATDIPPRSDGAYTQDERRELRARLTSYLEQGGFIAAQGLARPDAYLLLQEYASRSVAEDIIERYNLSNARVAQAFLRRCLASSGRELSVNKVHGSFKSLGMACSRESLAALLSYYEEAYLLFRVREFSRTLADNPKSASKVYAVDPGMMAAYSPSTSRDEGQRLETAVFNALRRRAGLVRQGSVSRLLFEVGSTRREVDFAVGDALLGGPIELIQVASSLAEESTRKREISALQVAMARYEVGESWVVTLDEREEVELDSGIVHVVPAWDWLLH
ncbi:MAG: ATP-binding protein [Eggerthellaceae bacterium]|nr:ATP-binding protein [Eggerthellaceae bacterium]